MMKLPLASRDMPKQVVSDDGSTLALSQPISEIKAELFKALAHPARIRVLEVLSDGERSVGDLQPLVGIEASHLSQQLAVLRRARLVTSRKDGASVIYAVKDELVVDLLRVAKRLRINSLAETSDLLADLRSAV
jgi:DNA-binding transcriptional ArsR family regulator